MKKVKKSKNLKEKKNKAINNFKKINKDIKRIKTAKQLGWIKKRKIKKYRAKNFDLLKFLENIKLLYILIIFFLYIFISEEIPINIVLNIFSHKKRIGVINLPNFQNVGNILVKFAMFKKLEELGFNATIITQEKAYPYLHIDTSFINRTINTHLLILSKDFSILNEKDYDYLLVNSDQTWGYFNKKYFYDIAFLKFAENWKLKKFIYGASIEDDKWYYARYEEEIAKNLLKNFTNISFREKGTVKLAEEHLGIKSVFVLEPTLLINKKNYLNEIKNYKSKFNHKQKYIFVYQMFQNDIIKKTIKESSEKLNYNVYQVQINTKDYIESFLFWNK